MEDQLSRIKETIVSILNSLDLELYDLEYAGNARMGVLRVFIDKPGGVTLEDCTKASRNIGPALDVYNFIDHAYTLEVSSPGIDRPLKKIKDFQKIEGQRIRVKTVHLVEGQKVFTGQLISVAENGTIDLLITDQKKEKNITILFENIASANLEAAG
jgi:ribosome maturation factor RimP